MVHFVLCGVLLILAVVFFYRAMLFIRGTSVGFVAAAVSKPMGGCRAGRCLVVDVDVSVATELTVL